MDREEAVQLMAGIEKVNAQLNELAETFESIDDAEIKKRVKRAFGQAAGLMWFEIMAPICRQFPDLDPDVGRLDK